MRPWTDVPDQTGRRVVITGANSGVGFETARILGSRGAEVVLACRDLEKADAAARLVPGHAAGRVTVGHLDVASLVSVRAFAAAVTEEYDGIDVLINNAGVLGAPYALTPEGVDTHFATNHLGHFALTNLLLPVLRDRVVVVGSRNHRGADLDLQDLAWTRRPYGVFASYGASKLANLLFLAELDRRLAAEGGGRRAVGAHPGASATRITGGTGNPVLTTVGFWGAKLVSMPAWRGALNTVYAATMDVPGNTYIGPHGRLEMHGWPTRVSRAAAAHDPALARRLWAASAELTGIGADEAQSGSGPV